MRSLILILSSFLFSFPAHGALQISRAGKASVEIIISENASAPTKRAAHELATALQMITGATFPILSKIQHSGPSIFIGDSPASSALFGRIKDFRDEEILFKTNQDCLLLAGGGDRGNLYAVNRFLQEHCGVRWWTPWASTIPRNASLSVDSLDKRYCPPFELREPFWFPAFDPVWAARNTCNGQSSKLSPELGGSVKYKGFVHTFYPLVPPEKHFQEHPEWYSLIDGKRTHDRAQLCLTNPNLREFLADQVKQWLRESPEAKIISVSQNDWYRPCQ